MEDSNMLRRIKAWYLMIAFGVLFLGGGIFGYLNIVSPALQAKAAKLLAYTSACTDASSSYSKATACFTAYPTDAAHYLQMHQQFANIQNTMPDIYDMKNIYGDGSGGDLTAKQRTGLQLLYQWMQHGKYTGELRKWAKGYRLNPNNTFDSFNGKLLGYEDTFTSIHLVQVDFGEQKLTAYGYADLLGKLQKLYGYKHFPLIILGAGGSIPGMTASAAGGGATTPPAASGGGPGSGSAPAGPGNPPSPSGPSGPSNPNRPSISAMLGAGVTPASPNASRPGGPPAVGGPPGGAAPPSAGGGSSGGASGSSSFGSFSITANLLNPRGTVAKPALDVSYHALGFFFLKGWDPDSNASAHIAAAQANLLTGKVLPIQAPSEAAPLVFGYFMPITVIPVGPPPSVASTGALPTGMSPGGRPGVPGGAPVPQRPPLPGRPIAPGVRK